MGLYPSDSSFKAAHCIWRLPTWCYKMNAKWQIPLQSIQSVDLISCLLLSGWWRYCKKEMVNQLHLIFYFIYSCNSLQKRIFTVQYLPYNGYYSHTEWLSTTESTLHIHYMAIPTICTVVPLYLQFFVDFGEHNWTGNKPIQ